MAKGPTQEAEPTERPPDDKAASNGVDNDDECALMDLGLDRDDLNKCVSCGLWLPHCPTYRVSGDERLSPRGRITLLRAVQDAEAPLSADVVDAFETCVQCRGCEPACPSGVPYGRLIEQHRGFGQPRMCDASRCRGLTYCPSDGAGRESARWMRGIRARHQAEMKGSMSEPVHSVMPPRLAIDVQYTPRNPGP